MGDRAGHLRAALERLAQFPKTRVIRCSSWHETAPVGGPPQGMFLNGVAQIETFLKPKDLLDRLQQAEEEIGRPAVHERWGPRVIDLDLLDYDGLILNRPGLELPHPRLHERPFVLIPLAEIAPEWQHPLLQESTQALMEKLTHADHPKTG